MSGKVVHIDIWMVAYTGSIRKVLMDDGCYLHYSGFLIVKKVDRISTKKEIIKFWR